ncbi:MAG: hypothetical protein R3F60_13325 [bacterium]
MKTLLLSASAALALAGCRSEPATSPAPAAAPVREAPRQLAADALPDLRRSPREALPAAHVVLEITPSRLMVDVGPTWDQVPAAERAGWSATRPAPQAVGFWDDAAAAATEDPLPDLTTALQAAAAHTPADGRSVVVRADAGLPYGLVARVLSAAWLAGYRRWYIEGRDGAVPVEQARLCDKHATSPTPCTTTYALATSEALYLQSRPVAEAGCAIPLAPVPWPTAMPAPPPRDRCRRLPRQQGKLLLGVIEPHRQKHIQGDRCDLAALAAWPEVTWGEVAGAADALRAAGHGRVALGIDRARTTCQGDGP